MRSVPVWHSILLNTRIYLYAVRKRKIGAVGDNERRSEYDRGERVNSIYATEPCRFRRTLMAAASRLDEMCEA